MSIQYKVVKQVFGFDKTVTITIFTENETITRSFHTASWYKEELEELFFHISTLFLRSYD